MTISPEYIDHQLTDWARNLWALQNASNPKQMTSQESHDFSNWYYGDSVKNHKTSFSQKAFTLYCYGLAHLGNNKVTDKLGDNRLVNAWRRTYWKDHLQTHYNKLDQILDQVLKTKGKAAALSAFPKTNANASEFIEAMEDIEYDEKLVSQISFFALTRAALTQNIRPNNQPKFRK